MLEIAPTSKFDKLSSLARNSESTSYGFSKSDVADTLKLAGVSKFYPCFLPLLFFPYLAYEGEVYESSVC